MLGLDDRVAMREPAADKPDKSSDKKDDKKDAHCKSDEGFRSETRSMGASATRFACAGGPVSLFLSAAAIPAVTRW
jgi:hypothetical protein